MAFVVSPNMGLTIPGVGTELGPQYATDINDDLNTLDSHDHSPGNGVQVTPSGLNINSALTLNNNVLKNANSLNLVPLLSSPALNGSVYESGVDLYYLDGSGNQIRLTQGGSIVGTAGSIGGLPSGTASVFFASNTYVFQAATNTAANLDAASIILRDNTVSSNGLTLAPPNAMAANYEIVLPSLPSQTTLLTLDTSGNIGSASNPTITGTLTVSSLHSIASIQVDATVTANALVINGNSILNGVLTVNNNINIPSSSLFVAGQAEVGGPLIGDATLHVTGATTLSSTLNVSGTSTLGALTASTINSSGQITGTSSLVISGTAQLNGVVRMGSDVEAGSSRVVISAANAGSSLAIVRGRVNSSGGAAGGEGFSSVRNSTGQYTVTFTGGSFSDDPAVTVSATNVGNSFVASLGNTPSPSGFQVSTFNGGSNVDEGFCFIAIGIRT